MTTTIDCDTCVVRGIDCHDCVVTVLFGLPPEVQLDPDEELALRVLAAGGLIPPLRMVQSITVAEGESACIVRGAFGSPCSAR